MVIYMDRVYFVEYKKFIYQTFWVEFLHGSRVGTWGRDPFPLQNHKNIGFLSKTGPDPLKNHKAI